MPAKAKMTKKQAIHEFRQLYPAGTFCTLAARGVKRLDRPARDQAWNDFTDALCKEGRITEEQYSMWGHPWCD